MKKFFVSMLLVASVALFRAQSQETGGTLAGFLTRQGLAAAKLERRFGNHLFIPVSINNRRAALLIDTGSPHTIIDVNSVNSFGLTVEKTCDGIAHDV
jgi:predicted aspartyl protease